MSENFEFKQPISKEIFFKKYAINDEKTVEEVLIGVAMEISLAESKYYSEADKNKPIISGVHIPKKKEIIMEQFFDAFRKERLMPAGRQLANARPSSKIKNYNNCFTIGIKDSIDEIYNSIHEDAKISKDGGGVGINVSPLRPKDSKLSTGGTCSGPVSFLKVFNASAETIHSAGFRRAAHISILNCDHPDIEGFITSKQGDDNKALTQFNLSVGITDKFIEAVKEDKDWVTMGR
jgi:ribonucleoside-diphosphate reductase alpha chain